MGFNKFNTNNNAKKIHQENLSHKSATKLKVSW